MLTYQSSCQRLEYLNNTSVYKCGVIHNAGFYKFLNTFLSNLTFIHVVQNLVIVMLSSLLHFSTPVYFLFFPTPSLHPSLSSTQPSTHFFLPSPSRFLCLYSLQPLLCILAYLHSYFTFFPAYFLNDVSYRKDRNFSFGENSAKYFILMKKPVEIQSEKICFITSSTILLSFPSSLSYLYLIL
jgi:hypothetical protein